MDLLADWGEKNLRNMSTRCQNCWHLSSVLFPVQASQAAQEAEINARKAKNSVTSLLHLINELLEQLGKWP